MGKLLNHITKKAKVEVTLDQPLSLVSFPPPILSSLSLSLSFPYALALPSNRTSPYGLWKLSLPFLQL